MTLSAESIAATLALAKLVAGVAADDTSQDASLTACIGRASALLAAHLQWPTLEPGSFTHELTSAECLRVIQLPRAPVDSVASVAVSWAGCPLANLAATCWTADLGAGLVLPAGRNTLPKGAYVVAYHAGGDALAPILVECLARQAVALSNLSGAGADALGRGALLSVELPNVYRATYARPAMSDRPGTGAILLPEVAYALDALITVGL